MNTRNQNNLEPSGELAASIRDFRSAVTHVADRETARPVPENWLVPARKRRRGRQQRVALAWVCAALLCLIALPWPTHSRPAPAQPAMQTAAAAPAPESDTALLQQVDANISDSVPPSLAPLAELDSWNTASTDLSTGSFATAKPLTSMEETNVAQ
jgi:hypothetical protein